MQGTTGGHLVQHPCSSRGVLEHVDWISSWHRIASRWSLIISSEGDYTNSLGNLFQHLATHTIMFFLTFRWNSLCSCFCLFPLILLLSTTDKCLPPSSWHPLFRYTSSIHSSIHFINTFPLWHHLWCLSDSYVKQLSNVAKKKKI